MRLTRVAIPSLLALLILMAAGRVAATWRVYTPTFDEPAHLGAGMQLLDRGEYLYEAMHPPLARVAVALGPYIRGYRSAGEPGMWREGNAILNQQGDQAGALALARAGILPFLLLAILVVYLWTRDLAGSPAALLAVFAFTSLPPVLAHSGLATTDAAAMATFAAAMLALIRWLGEPTEGRTLMLGVAIGLALLAKMSALVFLPVAGLVVLVTWRSAGNRLRPYLGSAVAAGLIAGITLWAGYGFQVGPLRASQPAGAPPVEPTRFGLLERRLGPLPRLPIYPAPAYPRGLVQLVRENREGRRNYLLGETIEGGRWYFFPVALAVKTPLPFLLLATTGVVVLLGTARRRRRGAIAPLVAGALLAAVMLANINIGLRHVLPIYPLLAVCAGVGAMSLWHWRRLRYGGPGLTAALLLWLAIDSARAHPDYLPWFNGLAGRHPEQVLIDSDLDWGQDLGRLADTLRARGIDRISLAYHGKVDLSRQGLPPYVELDSGRPVTGWVAASLYRLNIGWMSGHDDPFAWLRAQTPVARVGHSILLYYIPPRM